ncbi:MAG: DNA repair protein RadA [Candidatus Marinimicrobia bacterium]|nr:DNA repair protein RadA [Candidatus Neomarinimicrobiota bacterium]
MAKTTTKIVYLCSQCGADFAKWNGQCPACHEWGTLSEFKTSTKAGKRVSVDKRPSAGLSDLLKTPPLTRISTKIGEVDRVLGGGLLKGSLILLGGSPGIGKSTLALQIAAGAGRPVLYISAEESEEQIALRARRLGIEGAGLQLSGENRIEAILEEISLLKSDLVIVDSIQTVYSAVLDSLPGSISQIRECGQQLLQVCKQRNVTVIIIGHVTKEGVIAGPKMLEHMVDTVLYLDGDDRYDQRILRSAKNRFGTTNEVGIFRMESTGMLPVENPSELFLSERTRGISGTAIYPALEGSRPILLEIQALVSAANFGTPQRNVNGFDLRRLAMLLAVLEKRQGLVLGTRDVFINLVGGLKVNDPAADLAVIGAVSSSTLDKIIPADTVLVGEVGLAGEVRSVAQLEKRVIEAKALGFKRIVAPAGSVQRLNSKPTGIRLQGVKTVREAFEIVF